jgi:site-specific recombinase XerD
LKNFCKYVGPDRDLATISGKDCLCYLNAHGIREGAVTAYWFNIYATLNGLFMWAIARRYLVTNPLPMYKPKEPEAFVPYIYSNEDLKRIFETALTYRKRFNIEYPEVIQAMLKVTYCLGLRPSETTHLAVDDISLQDGLAFIRETKFYKSRIVPFGEEVSRMLEKYLLWRAETVIRRGVTDNHLFFDKRGKPVQLPAFQQAFRFIREKAGIHRTDMAHSDVRLQDLRHTFATNRVAQWYRDGKDVQALLPVLSTYLGHCNLDSTAVYITFTNQLLDEAGKRFQSYVTL